MAKATVPTPHGAAAVATVLDCPEVVELIARLQETRWTGRPGYPIRAMVGIALVKTIYCFPTWTRTIRLVAEHDALRSALGLGSETPSADACYRFAKKLRKHQYMLDACIEKVVDGLKANVPGYGETVAIDGSDLPAYANGQRYLSRGGKVRERFSDSDATWGHRSAISTRKGGGYYGYKVHAAVCTLTDLPVAWQVETAATSETKIAVDLLDIIDRRGIDTDYAVMDRGYDATQLYDECERRGIRPIIALRKTLAVKQGKHLAPTCEHGEWTFAGSDTKRKASKWRCPTGECRPASVWIKADRLHPLVPRTTERFKAKYHQRGAVEREFGRLKHEWALLPLRVRGLAKVRLHADLTILAKLALALAAIRTT